MTWVRLDDLWIQSPEMVAAGDKAVLLALWCLSWSALNLTDGMVVDHVVNHCAYIRDDRARKRASATLSEIGFWTRADGGFQIVEWDEFLQSSAEVLEKRAANKKRQADWRERKREERNGVSNSVTGEGRNAPPDPTPTPKGVVGITSRASRAGKKSGRAGARPKADQFEGLNLEGYDRA